MRAKVAKTRRARWVELPDDLFDVIVERLPAREDRDPDAALFPIGSTDRLRMAIGRACRDGGVPVFSPHDLRHRRIFGPRSEPASANATSRRRPTRTRMCSWTTARTRAKLLERVRAAHTPVHTSDAEKSAFAATFWARCAHLRRFAEPVGSARANSHNGEMLLPVSAMSSDGQGGWRRRSRRCRVQRWPG